MTRVLRVPESPLADLARIGAEAVCSASTGHRARSAGPCRYHLEYAASVIGRLRDAPSRAAWEAVLLADPDAQSVWYAVEDRMYALGWIRPPL